MKDSIIIAPHADDEIIGCYPILTNPDIKPIIIYTEEMDEERKEETLRLKDHIPIKVQLYLQSIPPNLLKPEDKNKFYFPHPIYETHPAHRMQGIIGESLARVGYDVTFYSTEMNVPFKYACQRPNGKLELLNNVYPSQKSLWEYEHKYFLWNAFDKWVFK